MYMLTEENKPSGGLFQFMRMTKKIRHQPEQGGIYLDDLNLDEMDPEVAQLYLYNAKSVPTKNCIYLGEGGSGWISSMDSP